MGKSIMLQDTSSGVGKTVITAGLCRIFADIGYKTSPFKGQNVTTNLYILQEDRKIAASQALQARAARIAPDVRMNPSVMYFNENKNLEQLINGKLVPDISPSDKIDEVMKAYFSLSEEYEILVVEGAGSPVELNLNSGINDIANMGVALRGDIPVLLVADIDRGGMFASVYGTVSLMKEEERKNVKGIIVNRFKGDKEHFDRGVEILEDITGVPVVGIVPWFEHSLPEEDSLFDEKPEKAENFDAEIDKAAKIIKEALDINLILEIMERGV